MIVPAGTKELVDYAITLTAAQINDAELQANKDQPNGYPGLNDGRLLIGEGHSASGGNPLRDYVRVSDTQIMLPGGDYRAEFPAGSYCVFTKDGAGAVSGIAFVDYSGGNTDITLYGGDTVTDAAGLAATVSQHGLAVGFANTVTADSTALGANSKATGRQSFASGLFAVASGNMAHAEGGNTTASADVSHAEGGFTQATANAAHAEGYYAVASGYYSHAEGYTTVSLGTASHAEGYVSQATATAAHAEGHYTTANGMGAHAEGDNTEASGNFAHAEGAWTHAAGGWSHAEGYSTTASSDYSHAEGYATVSSGSSSHAEGFMSQATANFAHAEGSGTTASGSGSHAEGSGTTASGSGSHAEGSNTTATSNYSHAEGYFAAATKQAQHAHASGRFAAPGDAQRTETVLWRLTTNATATELTLNGGTPSGTVELTSNRYILATGKTYACDVTIAARKSDGTSAMFVRRVLIKNVSGTVSLEDSVQTIGTDINPGSWSVTLQADNTNKSLQIMVTGAASTNIRWVATVRAIEIKY